MAVTLRYNSSDPHILSLNPNLLIDRINDTEKNIKSCFLSQILCGDHGAKTSGASFLKSVEAVWPSGLRLALKISGKVPSAALIWDAPQLHSHTTEGFSLHSTTKCCGLNI